MEEYKTTDLSFAALLFYMGRKLERMNERINPGYTRPLREFVFEADGISDLEREYWSGELRVEPVKFSKEMKKAKNYAFGTYEPRP